MSKDEYPEEIQQVIDCLRGEGWDNEACAIMEYIDAQANQIAALKEIAIQERAAVLTADICDGGDGYGGLSFSGLCAVDGEPTRVDDYEGHEDRIQMARKQLEAEYEAMRK